MPKCSIENLNGSQTDSQYPLSYAFYWMVILSVLFAIASSNLIPDQFRLDISLIFVALLYIGSRLVWQNAFQVGPPKSTGPLKNNERLGLVLAVGAIYFLACHIVWCTDSPGPVFGGIFAIFGVACIISYFYIRYA